MAACRHTPIAMSIQHDRGAAGDRPRTTRCGALAPDGGTDLGICVQHTGGISGRQRHRRRERSTYSYRCRGPSRNRRWGNGVKSHHKVSSVVPEGDIHKMGNNLADAWATDAVRRSACSEWVAVLLQLQPTFGVRPTVHGAAEMESRVHSYTNGDRHEPSIQEWCSFYARTPKQGWRLCRCTLVCGTSPLQACPRCDRHEEVST